MIANARQLFKHFDFDTIVKLNNVVMMAIKFTYDRYYGVVFMKQLCSLWNVLLCRS